MIPSSSATLDSLPTGATACVAAIDGEDAVSIRLMEMGIIEGEQIQCLGAAPLGDPVEFLVRGYRLSLRRAEARRVRITPSPPP